MKILNGNLGVAIFLIVYHTLLLIGLPLYFLFYVPTASMVLVSVILFFMTGISITAGYHRFYAHRSYRTNSFIESILLFLASMAGQGSALRWAFDHRLHHAFVDTDRDPYSIKKGFWYAHFLWLFQKPAHIDPKTVPDLLKNKLVVFQDRYIISCMVLSNAVIFGIVGWALNDYVGAFVLALWTRLFALHHCTWFINSLAHTWGDKPFCQEHTAVDNYFLSLLTFGEGYHNYHHTFATDYRNGIHWFHFDPTKWLIWTLSKFGLASDLKKIDWYSIRKRMVLERKELLIERLEKLWLEKKEDLRTQINEMSDRIIEEISKMNTLRDTYYRLKKDCAQKDILKQLRQDLKSVQREVREDWRRWKELSRLIMRMKPLAN